MEHSETPANVNVVHENGDGPRSSGALSDESAPQALDMDLKNPDGDIAPTETLIEEVVHEDEDDADRIKELETQHSGKQMCEN